MNLEQALKIVRDHIRIGKGMELVNGVPEALEMVVEELAVTQKALELSCEKIAAESEGFCPVSQDLAGNDFKPECPCGGFVGNHVMVDDKSCWHDYFLQQAKEAAHESK